MNDARSNPELQLSQEELRHLLREGDPPFTRRELRMRERAEEAGLLLRVDGVLQLAPQQVQGTETVGMTRRQLRELAAQRAAEQEAVVDTGELDETIEAVLMPPERISTRKVAEDLHAGAKPEPESPVEQTARRPVVRPAGAATGEYTGEFDQIRRAMADINAAPAAAPVAPPERRSIFDVSVPDELNQGTATFEPVTQQTDAADVSTLMDMPVVTDDVFTEGVFTDDPAPDPVVDSATGPSDEAPTFPDWHSITGIQPPPAPVHQVEDPQQDQDREPSRFSGSMLLTVLQWIVIVAVAIVLGLLVWYAINRGFGEENPDAAGIFSALYYLRT